MLLNDDAVARRRPCNVEPADRTVRIAIGLGLLAVVVLAPSAWRWWGLLGLAPLASGIAGWCPVYAWLARD